MGIRDTSYYGWQTKFVLESIPQFQVTGLTLTRITGDNSGNLYAIGSFTDVNSDIFGIVLGSSDRADTWNILEINSLSGSVYNGVSIDSSGSVYIVGSETFISQGSNWIVKKSTSGLSGTFEYIDNLNRDDSTDTANGVAIDSNDNVYVCGRETVSGESNNWIVRKSTTGASSSFSYIDSLDRNNGSDIANDVAIDSSDNIYVVGSEFVDGVINISDWIVRKSTTGASGSFSYIDSYHRLNGASGDAARRIAIDASDNIFICGVEGTNASTLNEDWLVRQSTTGASASFTSVDHITSPAEGGSQSREFANGLAIDSTGAVVVAGSGRISPTDLKTTWITRNSVDGSSGSFFDVDVLLRPLGETTGANDVFIDVDNFIYVFGNFGDKAIIRRGFLTANSASLGPRMLATSVGYVASEDISGSLIEKFKLMNVSEFAHDAGLGQMRNLVLGTTDSGKIGTNEDAIIQVTHFGSVVHVMWPSQPQQSIPVAGFGDFSIGQRAGKLTKQFESGDTIDVTEFDHLALYCYLQKRVSGTLDNVEIQVQRRPLKSTGFAIDQTIEYINSGSVSVAELKDLTFKKEIDYGDLSIKEIAYPIDIPLVNIKELRITAKHTVGQSDEENKNLIVWGRLIKSEEET